MLLARNLRSVAEDIPLAKRLRVVSSISGKHQETNFTAFIERPCHKVTMTAVKSFAVSRSVVELANVFDAHDTTPAPMPCDFSCRAVSSGLCSLTFLFPYNFVYTSRNKRTTCSN